MVSRRWFASVQAHAIDSIRHGRCRRMRTIKSTSVGSRRLGARIVAWLLLFAFTAQCYATQIHIHGSPPASSGASVGKFADDHHGKSPGTPAPADCPICQSIAHTGLFFAPAAPLLSLPAIAAYVAPPQGGHAILRAAATHDWRSRAPPQG